MIAQEVWEKIDAKLSKVAVRSRDKIPYTSVDGVHNDMSKEDLSWWTNGFWSALMWEMYKVEKNEDYMIAAREAQKKLDGALMRYDELHHDVGFMWYLSCGEDYKITKDKGARTRALFAANILAGRFNIRGGFIRAWNEDKVTWSIIDCMMNIPLLYWASEEIGDDRFAQIARLHADMTMRDHIRPDGSVNHIVIHDALGGVVETPAGQGYAPGSSWSRGQAWAVNGFAQSYEWTKDKKYLDCAKRTANYFLANIASDSVPKSDFRAPAEPVIYDTTAGAIAACGLIDIAKYVDEYEKHIYLNGALRILEAIANRCCDWNTKTDSLVLMGSESYHSPKGQIPIIYGDYYFVKAIAALREMNI